MQILFIPKKRMQNKVMLVFKYACSLMKNDEKKSPEQMQKKL
jgi:hypothetical protein